MKIKWHNENKLHMQVKENNGVTYLTYPSFEQFPDIVHCFSTRLGGVSQGIFSSMNLSFTRGDEENAVKDNYRRLSAAVGFSLEDIVTSDQTHTTNVQLVGAEDRGKGVTRPRTYKDVDGMITNVPGVVLCTFYADCVPLYFVDPVHKAVGLAHSGWRGTVGKIGKVTIEKMAEQFGSDPEEIFTAIGPSICQDCYEVSEDVILEFQKAFEEKYHRPLKGTNLGQFHSDFTSFNGREDVQCAVESLFLMKKMYIDKLLLSDNTYDYMFRGKGLTVKSILNLAKDKYNNDLMTLYNDLYNGKKLTFDLAKGQTCFKMTKDLAVANLSSFPRKIKVKYEEGNEDDYFK